MIARLKSRMEALEAEFQAGQQQLAEIEKQKNALEARRIAVTETMLRIQGARQVLVEILTSDGSAHDPVIGLVPTDNGVERGSEV